MNLIACNSIENVKVSKSLRKGNSKGIIKGHAENIEDFANSLGNKIFTIDQVSCQITGIRMSKKTCRKMLNIRMNPVKMGWNILIDKRMPLYYFEIQLKYH